jgi:hypothetical protein
MPKKKALTFGWTTTNIGYLPKETLPSIPWCSISIGDTILEAWFYEVGHVGFLA